MRASRSSTVVLMLCRERAPASCVSTSVRSASSRSRRTERSTETWIEIRLPTMTVPLRSRIRPRGASTATSRMRLASATTSKSSLVITWRYQRREKSAAKSENTTIPKIDRRRRGESWFTGASPVHGAHARAVGGARGPAHDLQHRRGEHGVEHRHHPRDLEERGSDEVLPHHRAESAVQDDTARARRGRGRGRDPPRGAQGRVLQRAGEEGDHPVGERRQAERCLQHEVVGDPGDEPDAGAALRSCGHPRGDGHEQHQVALDPEDLELAGHAEPEGEGEDQEERHAHGPDHGTDLRHDGGSQSITVTKARRSVSAAGSTMRSTVRPEVDSLVDRTRPMGIDAGKALLSVPLVVKAVPRRTSASSGVRLVSTISCSPGPRPVAVPVRLLDRIRMPTLNSGSVMSCTVERPPVACTTLPARPAPVITGMPSRTRSEENTSELQSLMRTSYAVF